MKKKIFIGIGIIVAIIVAIIAFMVVSDLKQESKLKEEMAYIDELVNKENVDKDEVIATFLSVLELIKSREIVVYQDLFFDDILIKKNLES